MLIVNLKGVVDMDHIPKVKKPVFSARVKRDLKWGIPLYLMLLLPVAYYIIFCYMPMAGLVIAFKDYSLWKGMFESPWSSNFGFEHFINFLKDEYFWKVFRNTFYIGFSNTLVNFSAPIILALFINELKDGIFKKSTQTISYLPYFVSTVAIVGIITAMLSPSTGIINNTIKALGFAPVNFILESKYFIPIYVLTNMWKGLGWGTIIYLASMSNVNTELYEAADIEGAGRFEKMWYITLPAIRPTIAILLILSMPGILGADFETILLLQREATFDISDVIATYGYRRGLLGSEFDFGTALGLFFSLINIALIMFSNKISKKLADTSIW